jgi:5'-3' exonuclease
MLALLIDGLNLIRRIHAALPQHQQPQAAFEGLTRSVHGSLRRALVRHRPTHVCFVMDGLGSTWRHESYADYKANRSPMPADLSARLLDLVASVEKMGLDSVNIPKLEADDVIASMAGKFAVAGAQVVVLSTDTSFCQLLAARVQIYDHFADQMRDTSFVRERFGVTPDLLASFLSLAGLPSSNIPGVKGIGAKTSASLVNQFGALPALLAAATEVPGRPGELLRAQIDNAELALRLVTLKTDVHVGRNLKQLRVPDTLA